MANKTIPSLTAAAALTGAEQLEVVQGGNSRRTTALEVARVAPAFIGTFSDVTPTASQVLLDWLFAEAVTFADEFAGSLASVGVNPTATFVITVQKNGSTVGTISVSTSGVATFTTTGTTVVFASGDVLTLVAPGTPDATVARLRVTLKGVRV